MAVPKHRTSKQKKRQRRSHWHLDPLYLQACSKCGTKKHRHIVCKNCGFYKKKAVIVVKEKMVKET